MNKDSSSEQKILNSALNLQAVSTEFTSKIANTEELSLSESRSAFSSENVNHHSNIEPKINTQNDNYKSNSIILHSMESSENISCEKFDIKRTNSNQEHSTNSNFTEHVNIASSDESKRKLTEIQENNKDKVHEDSSQNANPYSPNINKEKSLKNVEQKEISDEEICIDTKMNCTLQPDQQKDQNKTLQSDKSPDQSLSNNNDQNSSIEEAFSSEENSTIKSSNENLKDNKNESIFDGESVDILGNKSIIKQTIVQGIPGTRPVRNSLATVSYKLFLIEDSTSNCHLADTVINESFIIGEFDILPAIDMSIQLMDCGERAFIYSEVRHCYGDIGYEDKHIPPISSTYSYRMKIDLEFHDWKDSPNIQKLSNDERLHWSDRRRQRGNFLYRRKEYSAALQCYRNALTFIDKDQNCSLEEEQEQEEDEKKISLLIDQFIQIQNNLAQVYLLNNQYEQCLEAVDEVLKCDSNNVKALFRQAKVFFELGHYDQSVTPLKLLLKIQNKDVDKEKVNEMLHFCETKLTKYKQNEKEIYKRMFSSSSSSSSTTKNDSDEKPQTKSITKIQNKKSNSWWIYSVMGSAVLIAAGLAVLIKH